MQLETGGEILSYTDAPPVKKTNRAVTYGPYGAIDTPFANFWLKTHYVNNAPFAAATELEVSHWGNIYVEERYQLVNSADALKKTLAAAFLNTICRVTEQFQR